MQSTLYCALNRHYVTPELSTVLQDMAHDMAAAHPDTVTQVLDAGFPFWNGMPLLPHLSHNDGEKADIAFYYENENGYLRGQTRSPIGYFAFQNGPTSCPRRWPLLRWDMAWLQGFWPDWSLDDKRMATALRLLKNDPRVDKIFVEPHLAQRYGVTGGKVRFQGCRAARHDDHIHMQL